MSPEIAGAAWKRNIELADQPRRSIRSKAARDDGLGSVLHCRGRADPFLRKDRRQSR